PHRDEPACVRGLGVSFRCRNVTHPPNSLMSRALGVAADSHRNPFTASPSSSSTVPIVSGGATEATSAPNPAIGTSYTSTALPLPPCTSRSNAGRGGAGGRKAEEREGGPVPPAPTQP